MRELCAEQKEKRKEKGRNKEHFAVSKWIAIAIHNKFVWQKMDASSPLLVLLPPCFPVSSHFTNGWETDGPTDLQTDRSTFIFQIYVILVLFNWSKLNAKETDGPTDGPTLRTDKATYRDASSPSDPPTSIIPFMVAYQGSISKWLFQDSALQIFCT